jgi:hypothetical protein
MFSIFLTVVGLGLGRQNDGQNDGQVESEKSPTQLSGIDRTANRGRKVARTAAAAAAVVGL